MYITTIFSFSTREWALAHYLEAWLNLTILLEALLQLTKGSCCWPLQSLKFSKLSILEKYYEIMIPHHNMGVKIVHNGITILLRNHNFIVHLGVEKKYTTKPWFCCVGGGVKKWQYNKSVIPHMMCNGITLSFYILLWKKCTKKVWFRSTLHIPRDTNLNSIRSIVKLKLR